MKDELTAPIYILFCTIANYSRDRILEALEIFLSENMDPRNGIDEKYILDHLEDALYNRGTLGVKVDNERSIQMCFDWVGEKRKHLNKRNSKIKKPLSFKEIFRPEFRDKIPDEVFRLLGPGEADAWDYDENGKRKWVYDGPKLAVATPFHILWDMGKINVPSKGKQDFITVWLNAFGVEYKYKTFDEPSTGIAYHHFANYLTKLPKD